MLKPDEIAKIWDACRSNRAAMERTKSYFEGRQSIPELEQNRIDGRPKSKIITNWTKYVTIQHSGFLLSRRVSYSPIRATGSEVPEAYQALDSIYTSNNLAAIDESHFKNAFLYGFSVETHGFGDRGIEVVDSYPWNWAFVKDESNQIVTAIQRVVMPKYSYYKGDFLADDINVFFVYTDTEITEYKSNSSSRSRYGETEASGLSANDEPISIIQPSLQLVGTKPHYYGEVPITVFYLDESFTPFLGDDFFKQCDAFDVSRSAWQDDIKYDVDSLLKTTGMKFEPLLEKDADGVTVMEKLRRIGLFPVPEGGDASYITRNTDVQRIMQNLKESRAAIHMIGCIPDLDGTIGGNEGTVTNISGIALKLMFHPMIQKASEFEKFFSIGLRDRVMKINTILAKLGLPTVEDYQVKLSMNIPFNEMEIIQYLPNLREVLSVQDQIKLLPMIQSPSQAYSNLMEERSRMAPAPAEIPATPDLVETPA
jgi:SPP1 family phage portal protein